MKFLRWLKFQFYGVLGYGACWVCGAFASLSWFKEKFTEKSTENRAGTENRREVEFSGYLCSSCWQKRMAPLKEKMDEFHKDFDKHFH